MSFRGQLAAFFRVKGISLPADMVLDVVEQEGIHPWYAHTYRERSSRWESWETCFWLAKRLPAKARILETGCGIAPNLIWLGEHGFHHLYGLDIDPRVLAAAKRLCAIARIPADLWIDDGINPAHIPPARFEAILGLNWTHLLESFDLKRFFEIYASFLTPDGVIVFDVIDTAYSTVPNNQFLTSDWGKPEAERQPSEYKKRYSRGEVCETLHSMDLRIVETISQPQLIPKTVYIVARG